MTLEIKITKKNISKMEELATKFKTNKLSFTPFGYKYGLLSEIIFLDNYGGEYVGNKNYDIFIKTLGRIDIKTKVVTSEPKPEYECSVSAYQKENECDYYIFFRTLKDFSKTWLLGGISKEHFYQKAKFVPAGTRDKNFVSKKDSYTCTISDLQDVTTLIYGN